MKKLHYSLDVSLPDLIFPYQSSNNIQFIVVGFLGTSPRCVGRFVDYSSALDCYFHNVDLQTFGIKKWSIYRISVDCQCL